LLVILFDGSGSMSGNRFEFLKVLVTAFINTSSFFDLAIRAAVYGNDGKPRLDYMMHDRYTGIAKNECIARVAGSNSYGGQEDAMAVYQVLQDAHISYAKNRSCFFVHISDEGFCKSFSSSLPASKEVKEVYRHCYRNMWKDKLHCTMVSINNTKSLLEDIVDEVVFIKDEELNKVDKVVDKVAKYVGSLLTHYQNKSLIRRKHA